MPECIRRQAVATQSSSTKAPLSWTAISNPEAVAEGRLGADSGTGYVNLSAARPGTFTLSIIHFIGGKEKGPVYTYTVTVAGSK